MGRIGAVVDYVDTTGSVVDYTDTTMTTLTRTVNFNTLADFKGTMRRNKVLDFVYIR